MSLEIRPAREADAAACLEIYRPFVQGTAVSFEQEIPSLEAFRQRMAETQRRFPWLVCLVEGTLAGYVYATSFRTRQAYQWSTETTVYVAESYRRRGVARALYGRLLDCLRAQGFVNAYAVITLPNPPSVTLHEALGYSPLAVLPHAGYKLGRWHDVGWWRLALTEPPAEPAPPRSFADVVAEVMGKGGK